MKFNLKILPIFLLICTALAAGSPWQVAAATDAIQVSGHESYGTIGTIVGYAWKAFKFFKGLREPSIKDVLSEMKQGFAQINQQLQEIKAALDQIINMINQAAIQDAFRQDEVCIMDSIAIYNKLMNMTTKEAYHPQRQLFVAAGVKLHFSIKHILQGLLGEGGTLSIDLLDAITQQLECHPRQLGENIDILIGLVNSGIYVLGAYDQINRSPRESSDYDVLELEVLYNRTYTRVSNQIESCRDETRVPGDMVKFMDRTRYGSNHDMAYHLHKYLEDKYDTKYWAVVVCSERSSRVADQFRVGRGFKDAFAMSYAVDRTYSLSSSVIDGINSLSQNDYNEWSGYDALMNRIGWNSARAIAFGSNCDEGVGRNSAIQTHSRQNRHCKRQWYCVWICEKCWDTFKARVIPVS